MNPETAAMLHEGRLQLNLLQQVPQVMIDCNSCKHLNITEKEQDYGSAHGIDATPHRCLLYDKRVYHYTNQSQHLSWIFPCDECDNRRHIDYEPRK